MVPQVSWVTILDYNAFLARKWPYRVKAKLHIDKKKGWEIPTFLQVYIFSFVEFLKKLPYKILLFPNELRFNRYKYLQHFKIDNY